MVHSTTEPSRAPAAAALRRLGLLGLRFGAGYGGMMRRMPIAFRRAAKRMLRSEPLHRVAFAVGARRGHGLTLLFHRVGVGGPADHEVVRTVPLEVFRAQLDVLSRVGDVVPAEDLAARPADGSRPRFALTFDDDYATQLSAAQELVARGLPGTVFLSGRALHGLGAYWWEVLEARIGRDGLSATADDLGVVAGTPQELAARCEATPLAAQLARECREVEAQHVSAHDIAQLAAMPGITIGFHTVHHDVLPTLDAQQLDEALKFGRAELAELIGRPVDLLAYPHGKATGQVASTVSRADYRLAWTGRIEPLTAATDPYLLGRWEPHELEPPEFTAQLAVRLHRADRGR